MKLKKAVATFAASTMMVGAMFFISTFKFFLFSTPAPKELMK